MKKYRSRSNNVVVLFSSRLLTGLTLFMALCLANCQCGPNTTQERNRETSNQEGTTGPEPGIEHPHGKDSCTGSARCKDAGTGPDPFVRRDTHQTTEQRPQSEVPLQREKGQPDAGANEQHTPDTGTPPGPDGSRPDTSSLPLGGFFRYGLNLGHPNSSWGDDKHAWLGAQAGANSTRAKLPEYHLEKWGYGIEVNDFKAYASYGMKNHVGFLIGATEAHSTKPSGEPAWKLDYYIPKNLHKPILINGSINPENYWALYVHKTVSQYKTWVKIWEVWNEPDWVANWKTTQTWTTQPPKAADLPRFNGSIFDYVRLLRVTWVAAKKADPKALIALGGLGYPSFLSAILRYTDNPKDGAVTSEHPKRGGAYFDVLNVHYYPVFAPGNSDAGIERFVKHKQDMRAELTKAGISKTLWNATEIGAPHHKLTGKPGGTAYARNFLVKAMVTAQKIDFLGLDWYILSDYGEVNQSTDPFAFMGLYFSIKTLKTTAEAKRTETGWAYKTLSALLKDARYDPNATLALKLTPQVQGATFRLPNGKKAHVLWAHDPKREDELAKAAFSFKSQHSLLVHTWDFSRSQTTSTLNPTQGTLSIQLTSSPQILIEN